MLGIEKYRAKPNSPPIPPPKKKLGKKPTVYQKEDSLNYRYPDFGPLDITNLKKYLDFSQEYFATHYATPSYKKVKKEDFKISHELGHGTFGNVVLAKHEATETEYAIKIIPKERLVKLRSVEQTLQEKNILLGLNNPFTIYLAYFMMDNSYLYFVLPYIRGGELFGYLYTFGKFKEQHAQFYVAQVILGLEYLHHLDLVYRDLKPENLMVDHTGYLKLVDFGFSKIVTKKSRTYTLCGTPEYMAPEIILNKGHGPPADWWATGVLLYELVSGYTPFHHVNKMRIYEKVVTCSYEMCVRFTDSLKDLLNNLLQVDTTKRFGNLKGGVNDIKHHKWFRSLNWMAILNRKITPQFIPKDFDIGLNKRLSLNLEISSTDKYKGIFSGFEKDS